MTKLDIMNTNNYLKEKHFHIDNLIREQSIYRYEKAPRNWIRRFRTAQIRTVQNYFASFLQITCLGERFTKNFFIEILFKLFLLFKQPIL